MEIITFNNAEQLVKEIRKQEEIINAVESQRIDGIVMADDELITYIPRGIIKNAVVANCNAKIEELTAKLKEL